MEYARIVDIHQWYTTLIDWGRVRDNFDLVGIRAGVGARQDPYLRHYVDKCNQHNLQYFTYHIPAKAWYAGGVPPVAQAQMYMSWPGVKDAVRCADIEPPNSNDASTMVGAAELSDYIGVLGDEQWVTWYSNAQYLSTISWPAFLINYYNWVAGYPAVYHYFEEFLFYHKPEDLPSWYRNSIYAKKCVMWQVIKKGDARHYLAIAPGMREADLSLSTVEKETCLAVMAGGSYVPPEPPPPTGEFMATLNCVAPAGWQNVRSEHVVITGNEVGIVTAGQTVKVVDLWSDPVTKGNVWVKITEPVAGWTALRYGSNVYLTGGG